MPEIDDYYEPFTYDYARLQNAPLSEAAPTARPVSQITGEKMEKITWGPNWEDDLAGEFEKRAKDRNMQNLEKEIYKQFENTFHMYLPRICNHCINPACVASCPSGSLYKREEDGIVLVDQDKCRGWRMCISLMPLQEGVLQLGIRQGREVHRLLPARGIRHAHRVLGILRRPHPLQRHHAV
jgi:nitrate reductase beta subunit